MGQKRRPWSEEPAEGRGLGHAVQRRAGSRVRMAAGPPDLSSAGSLHSGKASVTGAGNGPAGTSKRYQLCRVQVKTRTAGPCHSTPPQAGLRRLPVAPALRTLCPGPAPCIPVNRSGGGAPGSEPLCLPQVKPLVPTTGCRPWWRGPASAGGGSHVTSGLEASGRLLHPG